MKRRKTASFLAFGGFTSALSAEAPKGITVFFKLDFRMSGPTYGGERWVSPPTFTFVQGGKQITIEARAQGIDAQGRPMDIRPKWQPADPGMVTVTPGAGSEVRITVQSPGQSHLTVTSEGVSRELSITSTLTQEGNAMRVDISQ